MSNQALIRRDDSALSVTFTEVAMELKTRALEAGALVGKVCDGTTQESAVAAQREIASVLNLAEKARKACKDPILEFGRAIDDRAKEYCRELKEEQGRLAKLVADFQQLEQARVRAAQQAENERLAKLERERAAEMQMAKSHEQMEAIQEKFNAIAAAESPVAPIAPVRAEGQRVREEWEVTVVDVWLLAKAHPSCVKLTPMVSEIKTLLDAGIKVAGVTANKVVRSGVSVGRTMAAIEV